ncbi:MAG: SAM-dependent methyltransferase [Nitrospirae bacterium]|nr:SAM-dependent methyltransferase [Candidatus Manganitrophaceae bacterium]
MSKPELVAILREEITKKGPIPFVRFMETALYHPEFGYYTSAGEKIGPRGDFYTSSSVHPIFGELLAKQFLQMSLALGDDGSGFTWVEIGAGKGTLCADILTALQQASPLFFNQLRYIIVEKSPALREKQIERLRPRFPDRVEWEEEVPSNLTGIVFSNELIDAMPVHRLRIEGAAIQEIYVDFKEGRFVETLGPPSTQRLLDYLGRLAVEFDRPTEIEINLDGLDWIGRIGRAIDRGFLVTIDYGYPAEVLYTPRRPRGTFLCYYRHQTNEAPYDHIGEQDMTAHVDFTSLAKAGESVGLSVIGFTDQTHFLMGLGIAQRMERYAAEMDRSEEAKKEFIAMKQLMAPERMGGVFKLLIQGKNIPPGISLEGLQFKPFFKLLTLIFFFFIM